MVWVFFLLLANAESQEQPFVEGKTRLDGFFDLYWAEDKGHLYLGIQQFEEPFLFVNSLVTGLGSNDIGLDRGQLGGTRVVHFRRVGNRVFLIEPNMQYRAVTDNPEERRAVAESFAYATLWGGEIVAEENGTVFVDVGSFAIRDEHGIASRLKSRKEGAYSLDKGRSHYHLPRTKSFPDNTEIEVVLTFKGQASGPYVPTVAATDSALTLHQRYSFVRLPEPGFQPRKFHPNCGAFYLVHQDYAAALDDTLSRKWVPRHRLVRKDPKAERSELVEPLVYYVDSGAPAQIKQALIEGALWWNQAFEAAGIINGYRVEELPAGADPMDVRYNVIQWVHRSTRGWSYGGSVIDPRTGEIIKGHVTLGSLRVRQDRLLFEGMIPYDQWDDVKPVELALQRIRQLSAHEVGHTLGIAHNFAASNFGRASVMDYPAPLVLLKDGQLDFSQVYDQKIGEWDKLVVRYLYGEFEDEEAGLNAVLQDAEKKGLAFLADRDGRSPKTMHPLANVWDNGSGDPVAEFERVLALRKHLLQNFGTANLRPNRPLSQLESVLVPVYLHHRFQLNACVKSLGGANFDYGHNHGGENYQVVPGQEQWSALNGILKTLEPEFLELPAHLRDLIPPRAYGEGQSREDFQRRTWPAFDELGLAETAIQMTLDALLHPERLNRLYIQHLKDDSQPGVDDLVDALFKYVFQDDAKDGVKAGISSMVETKIINALVRQLASQQLREAVRAKIYRKILDLESKLGDLEEPDAKATWFLEKLEGLELENGFFKPTDRVKIPPGSPIGSGGAYNPRLPNFACDL